MSSALPIRLVLQRYFPFGGQQRDFLKIAEEALARGHRVQALVQSWDGPVPAGLDVVTLAKKGFSNHRRQQHFADSVQRYRAQHPVAIQLGFIRMPGLDLYFAADPCYRYKALQKQPRWLQWLPRFRTLSSLEAAVFAPTATTEILVLTERSMVEYQSSYQTPDSRFHLLPPAVTERFQLPSEAGRLALRERYLLQENDILLLMVGSHFKTKGVDRSLAALASLPTALRARCRLWIAGTGEATALRKQAEALGINHQISFLGGRDDVAELMQAADLLLQPSRTELAGMSIVEALSCGLPVLASGECGYGYHVQRAQAGLLLSSPFDQKEFNGVLSAALAPARLNHWRQQATHYARQQDLRGMATAAVNLIEALASAGERKRR